MKKIWGVGKIFVILLILLAVDIAAVVIVPDYAMETTISTAVIGIVVTVFSLLGLHSNIGKIISKVSKGISTAHSKALNELKVPVLITTEYGEIVWYNPSFEEDVKDAAMNVGKNVDDVFGHGFRTTVQNDGKTEIALGDRIFSVTDSGVDGEGTPLRIYYLFDITELRRIAREYE